MISKTRLSKVGWGGVVASVMVGLCILVPTGLRADEASAWVTPKRTDAPAPHPRLFVTQEQLARTVAGRGDMFAHAYDRVEVAAEEAVQDRDDPLAGLAIWPRAIRLQDRTMSLIVQWHRTRDQRYLDTLLSDIEIYRTWASPNQIRLVEGQLATSLAVVYDLLYDDLSEAQRARLVEVARTDFILPFLRGTAPRDRDARIPGESRSWWQDNMSNWNPVSSSGNGILAMAMYAHIPEAQTVIDRVNASYQRIFDYLQETEGGWVEGLGYWNWSMRYMAQFLISYERLYGEEHAQFRSEGFRRSLAFGTYFVPHGEATGFGNNQHGNFSPQLVAAAAHLQDDALRSRLQEFFARQEAAERHKAVLRAAAHGEDVSFTPRGDAYALLFMPDPLLELPAPRKSKMHTFPKHGWSMIADQWPNPAIYAAVRGGQLGGHHTHQDLLSWHGVIGVERMIQNLTGSDYYNTVWAGRAHEVYEKGSASKNTLFIGGLSAYQGNHRGRPAAAHATHFQLPTGPVLRLDATRAFWLTRAEPTLVCRVFHVIEDKGLLVLDRVITRGNHPVEARAFTVKAAAFGERDVLLTGAFETARMTFASDVPAVLREATAVLTDGHRNPPTMIRWQTRAQASTVTFATLLTRGEAPVDLALETSANAVIVKLSTPDWAHEIRFTGELQLETAAE